MKKWSFQKVTRIIPECWTGGKPSTWLPPGGTRASQPINQSTNQPTSQPTNYLTNQLDEQTNQPTDRLADRLTSRPPQPASQAKSASHASLWPSQPASTQPATSNLSLCLLILSFEQKYENKFSLKFWYEEQWTNIELYFLAKNNKNNKRKWLKRKDNCMTRRAEMPRRVIPARRPRALGVSGIIFLSLISCLRKNVSIFYLWTQITENLYEHWNKDTSIIVKHMFAYWYN